MYSRKHRFAETVGFLCYIKNCPYPGLYLGNLKTIEGICPEHWLQTVACRYARTEEFPEEDYQGQMIIQVGKTKGLNIGVIRDEVPYREMMIGFLSAQRLTDAVELLKGFKPERQ